MHRLRVCSFFFFFLCNFSSHYIGELCVLWARGCWLVIDCHISLVEFSPVHARSLASPLFWDYGLLPSFILSLWLLMYPSFGLLLSCFGHARAKNNSRVWLDLSCVSPFVWGCHPVVYAFFTELWMGCFAVVGSGWSLDCCFLCLLVTSFLLMHRMMENQFFSHIYLCNFL